MNIKNEYIKSLDKIENLDIAKLLKTYEVEPKIGVRFNINKINNNLLNEENIKKIMEKYQVFGNFSPIPWCESGFYYVGKDKLGKNLLHEMGLYYLQEPSAMAPVEFLNIKPNDIVLDLCASPGGKTTQIAQKLTDGFLISNEIISQRAKVLTENVQRLGFDNVIVTNHSPKELENKFSEFFDKILVDAPCSGEGMFRKNINAEQEWNENTPKQCATRQKAIVESAYKMLKCSGTMVYSTCTFSLEENEEIIKYLLDNHKDLELCTINHSKYNFDFGVDIDNSKRLTNCARLYPYKIDGEGHFFAVIKKKNNDEINSKQNYSSDNKFIKNYIKISKNSKNSQNFVQNIKIFEEFQKKYLNVKFDNFVMFGENFYSNCKINLNGLKVNLAGLFLGEIRKNNFFPSLHLAHFLKPAQVKNLYELTDIEAKKYLEGHEIDSKLDDGWVLLTYKNLPLCFGKSVGKKIKNHYPKNLRKKF